MNKEIEEMAIIVGDKSLIIECPCGFGNPVY